LTARSCVLFGVFATFLAGALTAGASCYRAEVDLSPLLEDQAASGGGVVSAGAGEASMSGSVGATTGGTSGGADGRASGGADGGAAGTPTCDPTPEDAVQHQCRLRLPSKQSCDEQDAVGWNGCYAGGCSICTKILIEYPYYLERHRCCQANATCGVHAPVRCSSLCPPPTELDKRPLCFNLER
jgi:hypothetical protein